MPKLPPPDPNESVGLPELEGPMPAPVVYYVGGTPSAATEQLSDRFLTLRPGALIVFHAT